MKRHYQLLIAIFFLAAAVMFAQGPHGPGNNAATASRQAATIDVTTSVTVTGVVTAIDLSYGTHYPSITVDQRPIKLAPLWFLLGSGFELRAGDMVTVLAAPSLVPEEPYLYAIGITNATSEANIVLRDPAGLPLWTTRALARGRHPSAARQGARCISVTSVTTVTGTVDKLNMSVGIQMPTMVIKTTGGTLLTIKLGPERLFLEMDFEVSEGDPITAKIGYENCTSQYVALQLTSAACVTLTLRDDDGTPAWN